MHAGRPVVPWPTTASIAMRHLQSLDMQEPNDRLERAIVPHAVNVIAGGLALYILIDVSRAVDISLRELTVRVRFTGETTAMFIAVGRGKDQVKITIDRVIEFWDQVVAFNNKRCTLPPGTPNTQVHRTLEYLRLLHKHRHGIARAKGGGEKGWACHLVYSTTQRFSNKP
jgi:hypothetical protein